MLKAKEAYWILYDEKRQMSLGTHTPILYATREDALYARTLHKTKSNYKPLPVWIVVAEPEVEA
jgi:hypothetical protein